MLLKDNITKTGNLFFKYRGYQFLIYLAIVLLNVKQLYGIRNNLYYEIFCFLIALSGVIIRCLTVSFVSVGTSGRNTNEQEADELNITGMYSIVRNPLYLGNFLVFTGILLLSRDLFIILANVFLFIAFYTPIILAEEAFLLEKFKEEYIYYASKVNCIIPSFRNFLMPSRKFSLNMILMREHDTILILVLTFTAITMTINSLHSGRFFNEPFWIFISLFYFVIWCVLKYQKKYKRILMDLLFKSTPVET